MFRMELIETNYKIRCEMGACRKPAVYTVKLNRVGIRSRLHLCEDCLNELYRIIGEKIIPKSIETTKKEKAKKQNG